LIGKGKVIFTTVQEALGSLGMDKLGTVYYRAKDVFVVTSHGSGTFSWADWREGGGRMPSLGRPKSDA
jgi:hypothetical protein